VAATDVPSALAQTSVATPSPSSDLSAAIRFQAVGLARKAERRADYEIEATSIALSLESRKADIVTCFQGRPVTVDTADGPGSVWMVERVAPSGEPDGVRVVRSTAPSSTWIDVALVVLGAAGPPESTSLVE
jgi:hypothetical protein